MKQLTYILPVLSTFNHLPIMLNNTILHSINSSHIIINNLVIKSSDFCYVFLFFLHELFSHFLNEFVSSFEMLVLFVYQGLEGLNGLLGYSGEFFGLFIDYFLGDFINVLFSVGGLSTLS